MIGTFNGTKYQGADIGDGDPLNVPAGEHSIVVGAAGTSTGTSSVVSSLPPGSLLRVEGGANSILFNSTALDSITQDAVQLASATRTLAEGDVLELERVEGIVSGSLISWWREVRFQAYTT